MDEKVAVEVTRGGWVESVHCADVAAVTLDGEVARLLASWGDPHRTTFLRSAWKPLQAIVSNECGLAERFGFAGGGCELAIMSASHSATDAQRGAVRQLLQRAGLDESALRCGTHQPGSDEGRAALAASGGEPTPLYGNCSGKHAGMLAACLAQGWPLDSYLRLDHPLQQRVRCRLAELMDLSADQVGWGLDGCGLPTWCAPLHSCALGFARLAAATADGTPAAAAAVGQSMGAHPHLIGSAGGTDVLIMQRVPGLLAKSGAEAALAIAAPARRLGVAIKLRDGSTRAMMPLALAVLEQLGLVTDAVAAGLESWREPVVRNLLGQEAGTMRAVLRLA